MLGKEQSKGVDDDDVGGMAWVKKRLEETKRKMPEELEAMKVRAAKETERVSLSPSALTPPSSS